MEDLRALIKESLNSRQAMEANSQQSQPEDDLSTACGGASPKRGAEPACLDLMAGSPQKLVGTKVDQDCVQPVRSIPGRSQLGQPLLLGPG